MIYSILLISFLLRLISLNQSFWLDEATSATVATKSMSEILSFAKADFHPPLYYILLHLWTMVSGTSEVGIRMVSVLFGVGTVYLVYRLSKNSFAALLVATSPLLVYYSQEARMYSMLTFFITLSVYAYKKKLWLLLGVALSIAILTDYLALLMLPVFMVVLAKEKFTISKFFSIGLPLFNCFLLLVGLFLSQIQNGLSVKSSMPQWWLILGGSSIKQIGIFVVKFVVGRVTFDNKAIYLLSFLLPAILTGYLLFAAFKNRKGNLLYWLWFLIPPVLGFVISFFCAYFYLFSLHFCASGSLYTHCRFRQKSCYSCINIFAAFLYSSLLSFATIP